MANDILKEKQYYKAKEICFFFVKKTFIKKNQFFTLLLNHI